MLEIPSRGNGAKHQQLLVTECWECCSSPVPPPACHLQQVPRGDAWAQQPCSSSRPGLAPPCTGRTWKPPLVLPGEKAGRAPPPRSRTHTPAYLQENCSAEITQLYSERRQLEKPGEKDFSLNYYLQNMPIPSSLISFFYLFCRKDEALA